MVWVYDNGNGTANAEFDYWAAAANDYNGSSIQLATITSAKMAGTWSLTFNNNTNVTLTAADGTSTNFVMNPSDVTTYFASGVDVFYGESANGVSAAYGKGILVNNVQVTGTATPINDSFTGPLSSTWTVQAWDPSGVVVTTNSSKYWLNWDYNTSLGYVPILGTNLTAGTWANLNTASTIACGPNVNRLLIDSSVLPAGGTGFFKLIKRNFTQLQVLMPGETNAPNTVSGKTGTPTAQTSGSSIFNVTVNAVDANWHIVGGVTDTVTMSSVTDGSIIFGPSASFSLVNGTGTVQAQFNTVGANTITATDTSDGTKTANTGSPTTTN
jgi:hypothetical protein